MPSSTSWLRSATSVNAPEREYAAGITKRDRQPPFANWSKSRHGAQVVSRFSAGKSESARAAGTSSSAARSAAAARGGGGMKELLRGGGDGGPAGGGERCAPAPPASGRPRPGGEWAARAPAARPAC